jgi:hypothetical protein
MYTYESFEKWMGGEGNEALVPMFALGKITMETAESIARRHYELATDCFDLGVGHLKALAAGDLAQLGTQEMRLASEFGGKLKAHADGYARIAMNAGEAYSTWAASLADSVKQTAAPKATVKPAKAR